MFFMSCVSKEMQTLNSRGALEIDPFCVIAVIEMTASASDHDLDRSQSGPSHRLRCQE